MSQISYRANLSAKSFPFISYLQGNTVIVGGPDQVYTRYGSPAERIRDVNTPQIYYGHNFMPTIEGIVAIGYADYLNAQQPLTNYSYDTLAAHWIPPNFYGVPGTLTAKRIIPQIQDGTSIYYILETDLYDTVTGGYKRYYNNYNPSGATNNKWVICTGNVCRRSLINSTTYAVVNGKSYSFEYDPFNPATNTFSVFTAPNWANAAVIGLALPTLKGTFTSNGYLLVYSATSVAWSSTTNPLDFTPSTITGAGGGSIQELKGTIIFCVPTAFGFIVYTTNNCVSATYTGNIRFPFKFVEIKGAGGGISIDQVAGDLADGSQLVYTKAGLQILSATGAQNYLPELNDFISVGLKTSYDTSANIFITYDPRQTTAGATNTPFAYYEAGMTKLGKFNLLNNRYITYSYKVSYTSQVSPGEEIYEYILVYDIQLERWGHLKRNHIDIFSFTAAGSDTNYTGYLTPTTSIGLLANSGAMTYTVGEWNCTDSVVILGKYKYARSKRVVVDAVQLENYTEYKTVYSPDPINFTPFLSTPINCYQLTSYEGKTYLPAVSGYRVGTDIDQAQEFLFSQEGYNHSFAITGSFNLTSVSMNLHVTGSV